MPIGQPAFRPSESVQIANEEQLRRIYVLSTTDSPLSLHTVLDPKMHIHAGKETVISEVSCYHMDIPLYHLQGLRFAWPEQALVDLELDQDQPANDPRSRASETYFAKLCDGQMSIRNRSGDCFCRLTKRYPEAAVDAANAVARVRCRHAFESLYGFDGQYD